jgi:DNA-binding NarL/FixJ family response regulator
MARPRIVLADDSQDLVKMVARQLETEFDIVAAVNNGQRAIEMVAELAPDLVVLDICMPILDGIETARRLRASGSTTKVIFLTALEDPDFVTAVASLGALGYVLKPRLMTDLVQAIHSAIRGELFCSAPVRHGGKVESGLLSFKNLWRAGEGNKKSCD